MTGDTVCGGLGQQHGKFTQTFPNDKHYGDTNVLDGVSTLTCALKMSETFTSERRGARCANTNPPG